MTKVLVFGVFDGLHEGHKFFLREAKKLGDHLIVVTPPDDVIFKLKSKKPHLNLEERTRDLKNFDIADEILIGDSQLNDWKILSKINPNLIVTGYDQKNLKKALVKYLKTKKLPIKVLSLSAFKKYQYKSSLISRNRSLRK